MNKKSFRLIVILITIFPLTIFFILHILSAWASNIFLSVCLGEIMATLNFFIGYLFLKHSYSGSGGRFLTMLWGGMLFRLVLTLFLTFIVLKFLEINVFGFIFSLLFFYVFYLIIEIFYLNLKKIEHFEH
jgi:hypothetical protein